MHRTYRMSNFHETVTTKITSLLLLLLHYYYSTNSILY